MTAIEQIEMYLNAIKELNPEAHAKITSDIVNNLREDQNSRTFQSHGDESEDEFLNRVIGEVKKLEGDVNVVVVDENDNVIADSRLPDEEPEWNYAVDIYVTGEFGALRRVGISDYERLGYDELHEIAEEFEGHLTDDDINLLISVVDLNANTTSHYEYTPMDAVHGAGDITQIEVWAENGDDHDDPEEFEFVEGHTLDPLVILSSNTADGDSTQATFYDLEAYAEYLNSVDQE